MIYFCRYDEDLEGIMLSYSDVTLENSEVRGSSAEKTLRIDVAVAVLQLSARGNAARCLFISTIMPFSMID